jgi:hypothetical protein
MDNETGATASSLHTLISLADFKALLGVDDREDRLSRYCLITATFTIEQYCKRRLLRKKHSDYLTFTGPENFTGSGDILGPHAARHYFGDTLTGSRALLGGGNLFSLREYPVRKVLSIHVDKGRVFGAESLVNPEHYYCLPDEGVFEDLPFSLVIRPPSGLPREEGAIRVQYAAGYSADKVPPDLASACLELAAWNMARYRGRRIGMTGAVRRNGQDGEHLEPSMPENVRQLLEPYKRRTI